MAQPDSTPRSLVSDCDRLVSSTRSKPVPLKLVMLLGVTCALAVGNVYFAQPLLTAMAQTFAVSAGSTGVVVTATQVGYGLGLLFVVPLGDLFNGRLLIVCQLLMLALAVLLVSLAPDFYALLIAMSLVGLMAVVVQVVVAYAASLSSAAQRGQVVGMVTGGVVLGILLARLTAGAIADLAGWRAVYLSSAALLVLLAAILWRTAPGQSVPMKRPAWRTLMRAFFRLFLDEPLLRVRGILAMLIFAAFSVFWTAMVLPLSQLHFSHTETGLFGLAGIAGALGAGRHPGRTLGGSGIWPTYHRHRPAAADALMAAACVATSLNLAVYRRGDPARFCGAGGTRQQSEPAASWPARRKSPADRCLYVFLLCR